MKLKLINKYLNTDNTIIMGVHNATPDSFSDGGIYNTVEMEINHCCQMYDDGADIIDIGGESTKPGDNSTVSVKDELSRVIPVIRGLRRKRPDCTISIDTMKPDVAVEAVKAGANIINDVSGLRYSDDMAKVAAETGAGLILMHMKEAPKSASSDFKYNDLIKDIYSFLFNATEKARSSGVNKSNIIIDPGLGGGSFGKTLNQNLEILSKIDFLKSMEYPILIGASRKGFIGEILDEPKFKKRIYGNLAIAAWAALKNIEIIRVHEVKETSQFLKVYNKINNFKEV